MIDGCSAPINNLFKYFAFSWSSFICVFIFWSISYARAACLVWNSANGKQKWKKCQWGSTWKVEECLHCRIFRKVSEQVWIKIIDDTKFHLPEIFFLPFYFWCHTIRFYHRCCMTLQFHYDKIKFVGREFRLRLESHEKLNPFFTLTNIKRLRAIM